MVNNRTPGTASQGILFGKDKFGLLKYYNYICVMDKYQCTECKWEGKEDERVEVKVPYTDFACPKCGCLFMINLTEEEYITNWSKTVNPNQL